MTTLATDGVTFQATLVQKYGPVLSISDLAELLHITPKGVYKQIEEGRLALPHFKHGNKYLFPTPEVAAALYVHPANKDTA